MRRRVLRLLLAVALAALGAAVWRGAWLVGTQGGARWILGALNRHTGLRLTARTVEGRLFGQLTLMDARLRFAQVEVRIHRLVFRLDRSPLLAGRLVVPYAVLEGVRIQDDTLRSAAPPDLSWPEVSGLAAKLSARLGSLRVSDLAYRRLDTAPVAIASLGTSLAWGHGTLTLNDLAVVSPSGSVAGRLRAGFGPPALEADLALALARPVGGVDRLAVRGRFLAGRGVEQLTGNLVVTGSAGALERLKVSGQVGLTSGALLVRQMSLTQPGLEGEMTAEGRLDVTAPQPAVALKIRATRVDLARAFGQPTDLSGTLELQGTLERYQGQFAFTNAGKAWRAAGLASAFQGDAGGLRLGPMRGSLMEGSLAGDLALDWRDGLTVSGTLRARKLNPARVAPDWTGLVNLDFGGSLSRPERGPLRAEVKATLLNSRLHGAALTGTLKASAEGDALRLDALNLRGQGFALRASGQLDRRIAFAADITDLAHLVPGATGSLQGEGWVRWRQRRLTGALAAKVGSLSLGGFQAGSGSVTAHVDQGPAPPLGVTATLHKVVLDPLRADTVTLTLTGTALDHTLEAVLDSSGAKVRLALAGGYGPRGWQGTLGRASLQGAQGGWFLTAPAKAAIGPAGVSLSGFALQGPGQARVELAAALTRQPPANWGGWVKADWAELDLAMANPWLKNATLSGATRGNLRLDLPGNNRLVLAGKASAAGALAWRGQSLTVTGSDLDLQAGAAGLSAGLTLHLADGGEVQARFQSPAPARLAPPEAGTLTAQWQRLSLGPLQPWLPQGLGLKGLLQGSLQGKLGPGRQLRLDGEARLLQGDVRWHGPDGEVGAAVRKAAASWTWQGASLRGQAELELAGQGGLRGSIQVPLAARFPIAMEPKGALRAAFSGKVQEQGLLSALFPGSVQESHGTLEGEVSAGGTWAEPRLAGQVRLTGAGAYLPAAGIHIKDLACTASLGRELIRIESFTARSGPGQLEGNGEIRLKGWKVASYRATLNGDRFEAVHFPELQGLISPKLTFGGDLDKLAVRGEILLPEMEVLGTQNNSALGPSPDVVLVGAPQAPPGAAPMALDLQIKLRVGDQVRVKMSGLDAQLGGSLDLAGQSLEAINSRGEIRVVRGGFHAYGVDLQISHGRVFYAGGPLDQPTLDVLALRTIQDVKAGVKVSGPLQAPVTRLYSEPAMPEEDILSYIVLGHPLAGGGEQASLLTRAAGALLSTKQVAGIEEKIKRRLGLSTLELSNEAAASGTMGYKRLTPAAAGEPAPASLGNAMFTVGKHLTKKLSVSFGRSLAGDSTLYRLRYDLSKHWQLESQSGMVSGVDAYYKVEFR